jgi:hypothetical protein
MPPNHSRSAGAFKIAEMSDAGSSCVAVMPSAACACGDSGMTFSLRAHTPPPSLMRPAS